MTDDRIEMVIGYGIVVGLILLFGAPIGIGLSLFFVCAFVMWLKLTS
jgi:hypothetical protein